MYINGWSFVHFISGMLLGFFFNVYKINMVRMIALVLFIHSVWEWWQIHIGMTDVTEPYIWTDVVIDTLMTLIGSMSVYIYLHLKTK